MCLPEVTDLVFSPGSVNLPGLVVVQENYDNNNPRVSFLVQASLATEVLFSITKNR